MLDQHKKTDTPTFHKTCELYKIIYALYQTIPKIQRYTLWQNCENTTLAILKGLIWTRCGNEQKRRVVLEEISENIDTLKVMVRLAKEIHAISLKNYVEIAEILDEMGRMIGGWIKSVSP